MENEWLTAGECVGLPDMPGSMSGIDAHIKAGGWRHSGLARRREGRGGGWEYHISLLPPAAQARIAILQMDRAAEDEVTRQRKKALWERFEALSNCQKAACEKRLQAVTRAQMLREAGMPVNAAAIMAARECDVGRASIFYWLATIESVDREDWLAALATNTAPGAARATCHEAAWEFLKSDYLRPEAPKFTVSYRLMVKAAKRDGWSPIPSERALRRRLDAEVPKAVQTMAREGKEKAKALYPAQRRSRARLTVMQAVNMDGHKIDVFVRVPWSEKPVRMYLIAIQELYSGKVVAWRLSDAETWEAVRLVIGDMVERYGIPELMFLDNGRAFSSHWISGKARKRFRFKVKEEDPRGLLATLGVEAVFTTPYSGQSKPIERAFRDLADMIAKHPFCAGAYTGNRPDAKPDNYGNRAIPLDEFRQHVAVQIADHNAQEGRRAANCAGRSFDETFLAAMEDAIVRQPTAAQRSLWLLAAEAVKAQRGSGEIHFQGNRYWHAALNQHAGQKLTIRFDPDQLHLPVRVYTLDNALICEAACIDDTGFRDVDAARLHGRARRDYLKAIAAQKAAHARMSAEELADILYRGGPKAPEAAPVRPRVTRLARGNLALDQSPADAIATDDFEESFQRALSRVTGDASIIQFPRGNEPTGIEYGSKKKGGRNPAR